MHTRTRLVCSLLAVLALSVTPTYAQSYTISHTTLNGAVSGTQSTFVLTSAAASAGSSFGAPAVGQCLLVEGELDRLTAVSSTTMTVQRPQGAGSAPFATPAVPHPTLAIVWTAPCDAFFQADPPPSNGNVACSTQPAPWINAKTGNIWWCNTKNNLWSGTNFATFAYGSVPIAQ